MRNFLFLCCALLWLPQLAFSVAYIAVVHDFSLPPMGKFFTIEHQDYSRDRLYLETGLREGDKIIFPVELKESSTAWVEVQLTGQSEPIKILAKDSPWKPPINAKQGVIDSVSTTVTALYAYMFKGESKVRYTQAMSRGLSKTEPLSLPLAVAGAPLIAYKNSPLAWFWIGGAAPFSLEISCGDTKHLIHHYGYKADPMLHHAIRLATLPAERARCAAGLVHYELADKTGATLSFDVVSVDGKQPPLNEMIRTLDHLPLSDGSVASQRLMLWNTSWQLPVTSSKRAALQWMLINGKMADLSKKQ